ncbi:bifunctional sugar phosphate isomerase/epimerase/4-hydroxyphenylpyruvate dioxygenase family protein [Neomicrococcus aestuarii]|uniref:3-dehydroshikimate dehydratase n=1 Tax=Neomicrococcus aestuarii TaxID=556325 RepID=A0A1L2ZP31_9MICC|nr:sugar phosphate isomerase/epimerase and 4-hydroxyphenylpyruvate domain-containing protein [Neomicrococcus aestuarii]APF40957.1 4-hydroxyphenylpyruvate dioxygenase [Neomicrococcus aestuarii]
MRTSIATVCISGTLEEKMHACAEAGFDGIEIFEQDLLVSPMSPEEVRALAARLGLSIDLFQPFRDFDGVTVELFAENLRRAEAKFQLMNRLGVDMILVCSNVATATIDDDDVLAAQLRQLGDLAARYGVKVAYEALAWGKFVNTYRHAQRIVDLANHPNIGTCLDSFHILSRGDDPSGIEDIAAEKIFFVQLADAPVLSMDILSWSRHYRVFPGQGGFDIAAFLVHLTRAGYTGPISLEIFNDVFRQSNVRRTAVDAMRSLQWLENRASHRIEKSLEAPDAEPLPEPHLELEQLPIVEPPHGIDFVEIKTEDSEAISELLSQLGFVFQGQHRRKSVQLWTQSEARVVINGQRARGTAPNISALAFRVDNPDMGYSRALELHAAAVPRHHTPDEAELRAVRAPDGTEVFFAHSDSAQSDDNEGASVPAWTQEFGTASGASSYSTALIAGVDHVNLAQPWQAFDEAVLFYESVLRLDTVPGTEVPSPAGLIRSQVVRTHDGAVRLALNLVPHGLDAEEADLDGTPRNYPEHVAFSTANIIEVARRATAAGMDFLKVPENYYEDLAARFRLTSEELAELKDLNLLYDEDADGAFVHFYTETIGKVFFEVVERRGKYDGYGAPNAPVRLAAQFERSRFRGQR